MVPFSKVKQVLKDRSDTPLGDIVTRAWLSREASSLGGKRTALAQQIQSGGEAYPATRLLQAALSQQETRLQEAKAAWKARTGSTTQAMEEGQGRKQPFFGLRAAWRLNFGGPIPARR